MPMFTTYFKSTSASKNFQNVFVLECERITVILVVIYLIMPYMIKLIKLQRYNVFISNTISFELN